MSQTPTPELENFSPQKFVKSLSSEHLEFLSEFYDEVEDQLQLLTQAGAKFKPPTGHQILQIFQAAEEELADRYSPQDQPQTPPSRSIPLPERLEVKTEDRYKEGRPGSSDVEWLIELNDEIPLPTNDGEEKRRRGQRLPIVPTPAEIHKLLDATKDHPRNHLMIRVLYASGIRRQELVNLRVADLFLDRNTLFIRYGKSDKDRYVLIDDQTSQMLAEFTRDFLLTDPVFDISTRTVNRVVEAAAEASGVQARFVAVGRKFIVHTLRHAYATHLYETGADIFLLKTLLGHLFLHVTQRYVSTGVQLLNAGYRNCHPFVQGDAYPTQTRYNFEIEQEPETGSETEEE